MSFAHATATKGLLALVGLTSFVGSTFGKKHFFHLQLVPHLTRDHQLWRLISRNLAFTSSIDLLISILLIFNTSITLERRYGTAKYASFLIISSVLGTGLEVVALGLGYRFGLDFLPAGPFTVTFSLLYNYDRSVPSSYVYKIFGLSFSSKSLLYLLSLQLVFSQSPNSIVSATCGVLAGMAYQSNVLGSRQWRIPIWIQTLSGKALHPLLASARIPRRSTRTSLEDTDSDRQQRPPPAANARETTTARQGAISEVVQTFAGTRATSAPSPEAVAQLQAMFPAATRDQINSALERGGNDVNRSVEYLL